MILEYTMVGKEIYMQTNWSCYSKRLTAIQGELLGIAEDIFT